MNRTWTHAHPLHHANPTRPPLQRRMSPEQMQSMMAGMRNVDPAMMRSAMSQMNNMSASDWDRAKQQMNSMDPESVARQAQAAQQQVNAQQQYVLNVSCAEAGGKLPEEGE